MPSEARKRELKEQYKAMRPEMGVFVFRCVPTGKNYVGWTHDLKGTLNSLRFQLELGSCREKALQEAWRVHGGACLLYTSKRKGFHVRPRNAGGAGLYTGETPVSPETFFR